MAKTRLIGALDCTGRGVVLEQEVPPLTKGHILVKVHASLISAGTELSKAKTDRKAEDPEKTDPRPFGYQNAGEVLEVGEGVRQFKPGDRVACMGGDGARHTNYAVVAQNLCALMPGGVSYEEAAYCHLAMTSLNAIRRGGTALGEYCVIVGLGVVGQIAGRLAQLGGMYVMGWDLSAFRCEIARKFSCHDTTLVGEEDTGEKGKAFTRGFGFDMAVMAFGGDGTQALMSVRDVMKVTPDGHQMGRICIVGGVKAQTSWGSTLGNLDLRCCARTGPGYHDEPWERGESVYPMVFMRWTTRTNMEYCLRLMADGDLDVKAITTHTLPLAKISEAVDAHVERPNETIGTVLLMEHDD